MSRTVRFNFYVASFPQNPGLDLGTVVAALWKRSPVERCHDVRGHTTYLNACVAGKNGTMASVTKLRTSGVPGWGNKQGQSGELDLDVDEGVTEDISFMFHKMTSVLVLQSSLYGVSAAALSEYLSHFAGDTLHLDPIPDLGDPTEISSAEYEAITDFTLTMAPAHGPVAAHDPAVPTDDILRLQRRLQNPSITVTVKSGRSWASKSLPASIVEDIARKALGTGKVKKLRIGARTTDHEMKIIDLVTGRLSFAAEVSLTNGRRLRLANVRQALVDAWTAHADRLTNAYG